MRVSLYTEMCIKGYNSIFALHDRNSFVLIYSDLLVVKGLVSLLQPLKFFQVIHHCLLILMTNFNRVNLILENRHLNSDTSYAIAMYNPL